MFRKSLIALAATAALATGIAATTTAAEAHHHHGLDITLGFGGFGGGGYYGGGIYDSGYDGGFDGGYGGSCGYQWVHHKVWNWNHTYKIWVTQKVPFCY